MGLALLSHALQQAAVHMCCGTGQAMPILVTDSCCCIFCCRQVLDSDLPCAPPSDLKAWRTQQRAHESETEALLSLMSHHATNMGVSSSRQQAAASVRRRDRDSRHWQRRTGSAVVPTISVLGSWQHPASKPAYVGSLCCTYVLVSPQQVTQQPGCRFCFSTSLQAHGAPRARHHTTCVPLQLLHLYTAARHAHPCSACCSWRRGVCTPTRWSRGVPGSALGRPSWTLWTGRGWTWWSLAAGGWRGGGGEVHERVLGQEGMVMCQVSTGWRLKQLGRAAMAMRSCSACACAIPCANHALALYCVRSLLQASGRHLGRWQRECVHPYACSLPRGGGEGAAGPDGCHSAAPAAAQKWVTCPAQVQRSWRMGSTYATGRPLADTLAGTGTQACRL